MFKLSRTLRQFVFFFRFTILYLPLFLFLFFVYFSYSLHRHVFCRKTYEFARTVKSPAGARGTSETTQDGERKGNKNGRHWETETNIDAMYCATVAASER